MKIGRHQEEKNMLNLQVLLNNVWSKNIMVVDSILVFIKIQFWFCIWNSLLHIMGVFLLIIMESEVMDKNTDLQ